MADTPNEKPEATTPTASAEDNPIVGDKAGIDGELTPKDDAKTEDDAPKNTEDESKESGSAEKPAEDSAEKPDEDVEMKETNDTAAAGDEADVTAEVVETPAAKGKGRRKSTVGESKGKTLSKKASKARLTHIDAQPGDQFLVKLKGFPAWPAIICDESMLPSALINSRPVSAARPDGSYNEPYAEGGKRVHDRSFPVMYLHTNEFGWIANTALSELSAEKAKDTIAEKMRKDLRAAFELAAEDHSIEHYKDILQSFQDELTAQEEAKKEALATPKKSKKGKAKVSDDDDVEMADVDEVPKSKSKKRKAEEEINTPQRSESVKKPKIKLNTSTTPKATNGAATPKGKDASAAKATKSKGKKGKEVVEKKTEIPKELKLTPEERHARKEKEVLYLRHKLQRGLLTREQLPREDEMDSMSNFIALLENFNDLEVSIIRSTKINKVLKAIMKLDSVPREEEFNFKKRSQSLLDKWNKLLATDGTPAAANGVNGATDSHDGEKITGTNGVKASGDAPKKSTKATKAASEDAETKDKVVETEAKNAEEADKEGEKAEDDAPPAEQETAVAAE